MSWIENNRTYLTAESERVRAHIAELTDPRPATPFEEPPPALVVLQRMFRLSPFRPGDSGYTGSMKQPSWRLVSKGAGAHLFERANVKNRPSFAKLDQNGTPRY